MDVTSFDDIYSSYFIIIISWKYSLSTAAAAITVYILVDVASILKQKLFELRLRETILNIKSLDEAIRKNMSLFRDYKYLSFEDVCIERFVILNVYLLALNQLLTFFIIKELKTW